MRGHLEAIRVGLDDIRQMPPGDIRTEAVALGRFALDQLEAERAIVDVFEREGERIAELRDMFRERISDPSYRNMADILRRWLGHGAADKFDTTSLEASALLLLGALVNVHRSTWTFGAAPLGLDDDRVLAAWADQCMAVVEGLRHANS
ncbi:MAG: hypothetical protein ACRDWI_15495 [Jiangellaceae bacterium]